MRREEPRASVMFSSKTLKMLRELLSLTDNLLMEESADLTSHQAQEAVQVAPEVASAVAVAASEAVIEAASAAVVASEVAIEAALVAAVASEAVIEVALVVAVEEVASVEPLTPTKASLSHPKIRV